MPSVAIGRAVRAAATSLAGAAIVAAALAGAGPAAARAAEPDGFAAMVDRPLFSPTRRPPPAPIAMPAVAAAPPAPPAPAMPDVALSGVIAGGGGGVALLRRPQDAAPIRLRLGGQVDGWTLAEIRPRAVVLRRDDRAVTVDLPAAAH